MSKWRLWLIKKLVGKCAIMYNVHFTDGIKMKRGQTLQMHGCHLTNRTQAYAVEFTDD